MNVTAQIPKTTRNKETMGMGLTQPVFPKVVDKLNRTIDRQDFEAITHRETVNEH